ncbi:60S acidic ribosomal protein P2 [Nowakowskiella sp. JEL0407]|nr:60S acidic ribosomal protein P2 [Nowakowskiella sp. JEL0407]
MIVAKHQTETEHGIMYDALLERCREQFIASNAIMFRSLLTEYTDHKVLVNRETDDGEILVIPSGFLKSLAVNLIALPLSTSTKYLAAYLLASLGGNASPSSDDIKSILSAVGIESDDDRLEFLLGKISGKDINELIAEGASKLASLPAGGAVSAAPVAAATSSASAPADSAPAAKEAKKEEVKEESDDDMGFGLFD